LPRSTDAPGIRFVELNVGDATLEFSPDDIAEVIRTLMP